MPHANLAAVAQPAQGSGDEAPSASLAIDDVASTGTWWSPVTAMLLGMVALAIQLVSYYSRELLPTQISSGAPLDRFDELLTGAALTSSLAMGLVATLVAALALGLIVVGLRRSVREPLLQGAAAVFAVLALVAPWIVGRMG